MKAEPVREIVIPDVAIEFWLKDRKIEAAAVQVWMCMRDLDRQASLCSADVNQSSVFGPWETGGERLSRQQASAGHAFRKTSESPPIFV